MDQNNVDLDTTSGIIKSCHHAIFDKAWYLQRSRPPAAQLLYNLGLEAESNFVSINSILHPTSIETISPVNVTWPPTPPVQSKKGWTPPPLCLYAPLPLRMMEAPTPITAHAARMRINTNNPSNEALTSQTVTDYLIGHHDMEQIYLSPNRYGRTLEETLDLLKWDLVKHRTGGLQFITKDSRLILASMDKTTPGARIDKWRTRIHGAWLQSINNTKVLSLANVCAAFHTLLMTNATLCTLIFFPSQYLA
jgi:hypothetical protein